MNTQTNKSGLTSNDRQTAAELFKLFVEAYEPKYYMLNKGNYGYSISHDGFVFFQLNSNSFDMEEIIMIMKFCALHDYTLSFFIPINVAGIKSPTCEINICK